MSGYVKPHHVTQHGSVMPHELDYVVLDNDGKTIAYHVNLEEAKKILNNFQPSR
jgi:hypothetical protein